MTELPTDELPDEPVSDEPDPEEYEPGEPAGAVSPDTGTVYDEAGEAEITPQDVVPEEG